MSFAETGAVAKLRSASVPARLRLRLNHPIFAAFLAAADTILLFLAALMTDLVPGGAPLAKAAVLIAVPAVVVASLARHGCYTIHEQPSRRAVIAALIDSAGILALAACALWAVYPPSAATPALFLPESRALLVFTLASALLLLVRSTLWLWARPHVLKEIPDKAALVLGAEAAAPELLQRVKRRLGLGSIIAKRTDQEGWREAVAMAHRGVFNAACVIVSPNNAETVGPTLALLSSLRIPVKLIFDTGYGAVLSREISPRTGVAVFHLSEPPLGRAARAIKRAEDLILGGVLLVLLLPLMLAAAAAVKLDSRGPVLFRQSRLGHNNRLIQVLKFRTMYHHFEDKHASRQTSRDDPRVTRVGAFLRRHSLDELPQLLNVLDGSMSLIGPRPHALGTTVDGHGLDSVVANYYARHQIKPGITGWAQVSGLRGNLDSVEKAIRRVEHDLYYIENWSPLLDVWIMLKTFGVVLRDHAAF